MDTKSSSSSESANGDIRMLSELNLENEQELMTYLSCPAVVRGESGSFHHDSISHFNSIFGKDEKPLSALQVREEIKPCREPSEYYPMTMEDDEQHSFPMSQYQLSAAPQNEVVQGLLGLTMLLQELAFIPSEKIIIRKDHATLDKVKLLSGGSSAHEPLFSSYVGHGLLTAAVYGDMHSGPTSKQILAALRELKTPKGILIIIKNEIGERLAFGMAMEFARTEGIIVDMIVIGDDCWEHQENRVGRRCLAGLAAVFKVAGAMSELNRSMEDIYLMCRGMVLTSLSVIRITDTVVRFGSDMKGLNGKAMNKDEDDIVKDVIDYMTDIRTYFSATVFPTNHFIVLLNVYTYNNITAGFLTKEVIKYLLEKDIIIERFYCGTFVSGPFPGFSITLVKDLEEELIRWFDYPVKNRSWPDNCVQRPRIMNLAHFDQEYSVSTIECGSKQILGPKYYRAVRCKDCLITACQALISSEFMFNKMDPEEHYGTNVKSGARALLEADEEGKLQYDRPYLFTKTVATILEESVSGEIGIRLGLFFTGMSQVFINYFESMTVNCEVWFEAVKKGINTLGSIAFMREGDCTSLDALVPFYKGLMHDPTLPYLEKIIGGVAGAESGAKLTALMKSNKHRENWPSPGAQLVATVTRAIFESLSRAKAVEQAELQFLPCSRWSKKLKTAAIEEEEEVVARQITEEFEPEEEIVILEMNEYENVEKKDSSDNM